MALPSKLEKQASLAELRQQQKDMQAQINAVLEKERSSRFLDHARKIVEVIAEDKELALGYVPLVRKDYIIRDALRSLDNKKGSPQEVNEIIGDVLTPILEAGKDSLAEIRQILSDRSKATEKDAKGNIKPLRPLFKANEDGSYSVVE